MAILVVLGILYLPVAAVKMVIAGIAAVVIHEFARMALPRHPSSSPALAIVLGTGLTVALMFKPQFATLMVALPTVLMITFLFYLFKRHSLELVLNQVATTILCVLYAGMMLAFLGLLLDLPTGSDWLLIVLATTFGADTGAYLVGHLIGRRKLAPRVSPGKTVEGLVGGLLVSVGVALFCKFLFFKALLVRDCIWVGGVVGLIGPLGDLSESLVKRSVGVKDSGDLIPGHGGLLDRVDALLFTSPVVYYYAAYMKA